MAQNNMQGVAETFDVFGNKVGGTSVRVHAYPGGGSSFSFGGNYGNDDAQQARGRGGRGQVPQAAANDAGAGAGAGAGAVAGFGGGRAAVGGVAGAMSSSSPFGTDADMGEERKQHQPQQQQVAGMGANSASAQPTGPAANNMEGVAETYDAFGNKVSGTSVRVHAPPGGKSSITF